MCKVVCEDEGGMIAMPAATTENEGVAAVYCRSATEPEIRDSARDLLETFE